MIPKHPCRGDDVRAIIDRVPDFQPQLVEASLVSARPQVVNVTTPRNAINFLHLYRYSAASCNSCRPARTRPVRGIFPGSADQRVLGFGAGWLHLSNTVAASGLAGALADDAM